MRAILRASPLPSWLGMRDQSVARRIGRTITNAASIVKLTGPAGFGFVEDPFGFHMGALVKSRPRQILEIAFGVSRKLHRRFFGEPHPKTITAP